ncbi:hypothetical protein DPEC_G00078680 [Dallia pectoralis]|uniref:Uncharacterized protein n=1 Tax=Dallia pectoralis TaxID=75939 RepID=A0ACC2H5F6_DALPE|nr:hypothetical protein DPEC_G00078680 [Dallia pectoralis]
MGSQGTGDQVSITTRGLVSMVILLLHIRLTDGAAPVQLVDIQISDDIITCSSTGIYPEPKLTWSTDPPSDLSPDNGTSQKSTSTKVNSQGLYDIISTKPYTGNQTNICTVTYGTREKTTSLRQQDLPVTCIFSEECVLPCSYQPGKDEIIHWVKLDNIRVHSYYYSKDQLEQQDQQYKQRTALFNNQILEGNASLLLSNVTVQDQGRYKCYTSTIKGNQESFINIIVEAPVRLVDIQISNDIITCSSTGIYPEPKLTWSTDPPSDLSPDNGTSQTTTSTKVNSQGLYDITSTKPYTGNQTNICTVTCGTREKTATLQTKKNAKGKHKMVECMLLQRVM